MITIFNLFLCSLFHIQTSETPIINYLRPIEIYNHDSGIELIDCIYLINLDRRPQKWKEMQKIFNAQHLNVNRVPAVDGWALPKKISKELVGPYKLILNPGQIGCFLSHVSIYKDALERDFNIIWICEDDIIFVNDAQCLPNLLESLNHIDPDWDIFYTDHEHPCCPSKNFFFRPDQPHKTKEEYNERIYLTDEIMTSGVRLGMHSYIISKKGLEKILFYFTHVYLFSALDFDIHYIPDIREYSSRLDIVSTVWNASSIHDTQRDNRD